MTYTTWQCSCEKRPTRRGTASVGAGPIPRWDALRSGEVLLRTIRPRIMVPGTLQPRAGVRTGGQHRTAYEERGGRTFRVRWEGTSPAGGPSSRTSFTRLPVRGFTRHPSSGVPEDTRVTYAGLLREDSISFSGLGITAVETVPVFSVPTPRGPRLGRVTLWGYGGTVSFFAPNQGYCSGRDSLGPSYMRLRENG